MKEIGSSKSFSQLFQPFAVRILLFLILDLIRFSTERNSPIHIIYIYIYFLDYIIYFISHKFHYAFQISKASSTIIKLCRMSYKNVAEVSSHTVVAVARAIVVGS